MIFLIVDLQYQFQMLQQLYLIFSDENGIILFTDVLTIFFLEQEIFRMWGMYRMHSTEGRFRSRPLIKITAKPDL